MIHPFMTLVLIQSLQWNTPTYFLILNLNNIYQYLLNRTYKDTFEITICMSLLFCYGQLETEIHFKFSWISNMADDSNCLTSNQFEVTCSKVYYYRNKNQSSFIYVVKYLFKWKKKICIHVYHNVYIHIHTYISSSIICMLTKVTYCGDRFKENKFSKQINHKTTSILSWLIGEHKQCVKT